MMAEHRARPGRLLAFLMSALVFCAVLGASTAVAEENAEQGSDFVESFLEVQDTPIYEDLCVKTCHGNIAKTKNYASAIKFSHGYHILPACSSCHPAFPHRPNITIERPTMKGCFDCHGLRHGPKGELATGVCEDCHMTPRERLRPAFHVWGWEGETHVAPANKEFNTRCAMCHQPASCVECHEKESIRWAPESWDYNSGNGCQSCHGNTALTKQSSGGAKSFTVTGLDDSAHDEVGCQQCHTDYRYDDKPSASALWTINAGEACAICHAKQDDARLKKVVADYDKSAHAKAIAKGDYKSATCGSCHGGHYIYRLDTEVAKARMHDSAYRVCARCHDEEYGSYDDYYHGKAYKDGNQDAPSCWECHGAHNILPASDKDSLVNESNVGDTCGQKGCHSGSSDDFGAAAAELIHEKVKADEDNPVISFFKGLKD